MLQAARLHRIFGAYVVGAFCSSYAADAVLFQAHWVQREPSQLDPSIQAVAPIEWVHVPKAGCSFMNTLMHIPGICPGMPEGSVVRNEVDFNLIFEKCNTSLWNTNFWRLKHTGIENLPEGGFNAGQGRFMIFMRQPEQRMMSMFFFNEYLGHSRTIDDLKEHRSGDATKMLTRKTNVVYDPLPPNRSEVDLAKLRLRTGFAFVGITERWDLSMCLFSAMFKQACRPEQYHNSHPTATKPNASSLYDTAMLNGWRDPYDSELYDVATSIFESNLKRYNISESSCGPCWREAGLL